jgi:hypothetical protein
MQPKFNQGQKVCDITGKDIWIIKEVKKDNNPSGTFFYTFTNYPIPYAERYLYPITEQKERNKNTPKVKLYL